jgi:hypothetical protein
MEYRHCRRGLQPCCRLSRQGIQAYQGGIAVRYCWHGRQVKQAGIEFIENIAGRQWIYDRQALQAGFAGMAFRHCKQELQSGIAGNKLRYDRQALRAAI